MELVKCLGCSVAEDNGIYVLINLSPHSFLKIE